METPANEAATPNEGDIWRDRYVRDLATSQILAAAAAQGAYNPHQLLSMLAEHATAIEVLAPDGRPTGECAIQVRLPSKASESGKPCVLALDPAGAVEVIRTTAGYENLFKANLPAELLQGPKAAHELSTAEFMAARRKARGR